jgi:chromate transporter
VPDASTQPRGTPGEVFGAFARLGLTSFGGPVAHLGYFRTEFVARRRWLDERAYAELVALSQFLPGPASSKVGFTLGLLRAGWAGALCAWAAFTLPSALALAAFALAAPALSDGPLARGLVHGLKLTAVAIVAHAVLGMARTLCPDVPRRVLALLALAVVAVVGPGAQLVAIAGGAATGLLLARDAAAAAPEPLAVPLGRRTARVAGVAFAVLLAAAWLATPTTAPAGAATMAAAFYRAGALVFGGGHVVLPLLDAAVVAPGWTSGPAFLAGYGAAQAVPGPLFTVAAYLGAQPGMPVPGWPGAALALGAIFLPGLLLHTAALPYWDALRRRAGAAGAMRGVNAAVVGVLAAALWNPVIRTSVLGPADALVALAGFLALASGRVPPLAVVLGSAAAGVLLAQAG